MTNILDETIQNIPYKESPYIYFNPNPAIQDLLDNFSVIKKEFINLAKHHRLCGEEGNLYVDPGPIGVDKTNQHNKMYKGTYKSIQLFMRDTLFDAIEKKNGNWKPNETERIKTTLVPFAPYHFKYILKYKDIIGAVNYNISYPGSRLSHHYGLDKDYIRLHYCIIESPKCVFDIENWRHSWKEGEIFGFDDYYTYHGTNHDITCDTPRSILMIDIKKDYLKDYAKTWPVRSFRFPNSVVKKMINLKGWDNAET